MKIAAEYLLLEIHSVGLRISHRRFLILGVQIVWGLGRKEVGRTRGIRAVIVGSVPVSRRSPHVHRM